MRLASPYALILLLAIPVLLWLHARWARHRPALALGADGMPGPSLRARATALEWPMRLLGLTALVVSLARPQWGYEETDQSYHGIDLVVALDVSGSMFATDMEPNRMEAAKAVTRTFLEGLGEDRVGMVLFSGEALAYSPLTTDLSGLAEFVDRVEVQMVIPVGTNIEAALLGAAARFDSDEDRTRVIVLVTDGEQTVPGDPVGTGARACAAKGLKVYTIGVGSPQGGVITLPPEMGGDVLTDAYGYAITTRLDENTLRQIADITGGRYWRAETAGQLEQVFDEIAQLEKGDIVVRRRMRYEERSGLFLWPGMALLALEGLLSGAWCRRTLT